MANISNETPYSLLSGSAYSDTITNTGHHVTIYGYAGNDSILNTNRGGALTLAGAYAYIDAGDGNDNIIHYDWAAYGTVLGGAGDDTIMSRAAESTISGGTGNDSIRNVTSLVSMHGGAGNDIIVDVGFIDGINHGNTLAGGTGNDTISLSAAGYENVIQYSNGDGDDIVCNLTARDTVQIGGGLGTYSTQVSGSNVLVNVGGGKISLVGAANLDAVNIDGKKGDSKFITLTEGNDTYAVTISGATVSALGGNDSVKGFDVSDVSMNGGDGNDDLSNRGGNNLTLVGGQGNDSLWNEPNDGGKDALNISIVGGAGDDSINNFGNKATLRGGADNDSIYNYARGYKSGTLVFDSVGQNAKIFGDDGDDYIRNDAKKSKVDGGAGNDSIQNNGGADNCTLTGGDGDDTINNEVNGTTCGGANVFIDGGQGNDSLRNDNSRGTISGGADNDTLVNWGDHSSINGGQGDDSIDNYADGDSVTIDAGDGNDKVSNWGDKVKILTGAGKDTISNNGTNGGSKKVTIDAGAGSDEIHNFGTNDLIKGGAGNDTINNNKRGVVNGETVVTDGGKSSTIIGGTGDDSIINSGDKVTFKYSSGDGLDTIRGFNKTSTLQVDGGTYSTQKSGSDILVTVGEGKITLVGAASLDAVNIDGEFLNVINSSVDGAKLYALLGEDSIKNYGNKVTIVGAADIDSIWNYGATVSINGDAGNDFISNYGNKVTVTGGKGNDTLRNDTSKSGAKLVKLNGGAGNDELDNWGDKVTMVGGAGNDTFYNYATGSHGSGASVSMDGGDGNDLLNNFGNKVTILGGAGNDSISNNKRYGGSNVTIDAGTGDDSITNFGVKSSLAGGAGNDTIKNNKDGYSNGELLYDDGGKLVTIQGGTGNDSIINSGDKVLFKYSSGDGLDTIQGFNTTSTLQIGGGSGTYSTTKSGSDILVTVGEGKITLVGAASLSAVNIDGKAANAWTLSGTTATCAKKVTVKGATSTDGLDVDGKTIKLSGSALKNKVTVSGSGYSFDFASDYSKATITGSSSADTITARGKKILVKGGGGDDTLKLLGTGTVTGGVGADIFVVKSSGVISDYDEADKISLTGAAKFSVSGSDVLINGSVTLSGAADKVVTYIEDGAEKIFRYTQPDVEFNGKGTSATLQATYRADVFKPTDYDDFADTLINIKASAVKHSLEIIGNKNANKITGTSEDDTISGLAGGDTIGAGKGDDELYGGAGSDSLNGGPGNDSLWGGAGSDTLVGGVGEDVFIYQDGDGKDTISDYAPGIDCVVILSGEVKSPTADASGDVIFQIGSKGQITFTDSANKYIELVDTSGNKLGTYKGIRN